MFTEKKRVTVYIDGSNFYNYLTDEKIGYKKGDTFTYSEFIDYLVSDKRKLICKKYYIGIFRNKNHTEKSATLVKGQQKFLSHLERQGFIIERGKIMYDGGRPREKGTDVKIAIDMLLDAIEDKTDILMLFSSDTDLIPALKYIRTRLKKQIEYIGFSHSPSFGIQKNATTSRLLYPDEIQKFLVKGNSSNSNTS